MKVEKNLSTVDSTILYGGNPVLYMCRKGYLSTSMHALIHFPVAFYSECSVINFFKILITDFPTAKDYNLELCVQ